MAIVLVVDDEPLIRMNAVDLVEQAGFVALEAANADEAIQILMGRTDIYAVFTDVQMPGSLDGIRLLKVIRDRWPPVALLVTSGQVRPQVADLPENTHFLPKPYMMGELKTHLDELIH